MVKNYDLLKQRLQAELDDHSLLLLSFIRAHLKRGYGYEDEIEYYTSQKQETQSELNKLMKDECNEIAGEMLPIAKMVEPTVRRL